MDKLKTHRILFWCALALMVVFGIILIYDHSTKASRWLGMVAMALTAISQYKVIRDLKKHR